MLHPVTDTRAEQNEVWFIKKKRSIAEIPIYETCGTHIRPIRNTMHCCGISTGITSTYVTDKLNFLL